MTADPNLLPVLEYIDIYVAVGQLVADKDIEVASRAIHITSTLPTEAYPKVLEEMKIALEDNSSGKCNAFEVHLHLNLYLLIKHTELEIIFNQVPKDK